MNELQKKWLLDLQEKGVRFEGLIDNGSWMRGERWVFKYGLCKYRIPAQPIPPDIPDWRELCREMQSKGVRFKMLCGSMWNEDRHDFEKERDRYQLIEQPLPEWREEITEETKPDPREEIPHREQQIQWHEDMLHHLRTGEPMREWQWRKLGGAWQWLGTTSSTWNRCFYYRRKPRTVTYWHCVVNYVCDYGTGAENVSLWSTCSKDELESEIKNIKDDDTTAKFSPIIETTVEMED